MSKPIVKLNSNEFLALDEIMNHAGVDTVSGESHKIDLVELVESGVDEDPDTYNESSIEDISDRLGVSINEAKGYIGSLVKKGLVFVDEEMDDMFFVTGFGIRVWGSH